MTIPITDKFSEYKPDPALEHDRQILVEETLGSLINKHLRWGPKADSKTAEFSNKDYGHLPTIFNPDDLKSSGDLRPNQEPLNFRAIAGAILGIDPDNLNFEDQVRKIDGHSDLTRYATDGWYSHLVHVEGVEIPTVQVIKEISELTYGLTAHTEKNVPSYKQETKGRVQVTEKVLKIKLPAQSEWFDGIWIAEEQAHSDGQEDYGKIRRITTSMQQILGNNSQHRSELNVDTSETFGTFIYTTIQELATKLTHLRNSVLFGPVGRGLQQEEANDEAKHFAVYGTIVREAYRDARFTKEIISLVYLLEKVFNMPGKSGIPRFLQKASSIAKTKIYGEDEQHEAIRKSLTLFGMFDKIRNDDKKIVSYHNPQHISELHLHMLDELREKYDKDPTVVKRNGLFVIGQTHNLADFRKFHENYAEAKGLPKLKMLR